MLNTELSLELYWLTLSVIMTSLLWIPYIANRILEQGILAALWDRFGDTDTEKPWAKRMMQAHVNAVENLVIFAPLVLLVQLSGVNSNTTAAACMIYFFVRLAHYLSFTFALPLLRVLTFLAGFAVQITLAVAVLNHTALPLL